MSNNTKANETIHADRLSALTGLSDRRHRQLAKEGFFPAPVRGHYQTDATLSGLFRYYREARSADKEKRAQIDFEKHRKLKIDNDRKDGLLVLKGAVIKCFQEHCAESRPLRHQKLEREYPAAVACMEVPQARLYGVKLADELDAIDFRLAEKLEALGL